MAKPAETTVFTHIARRIPNWKPKVILDIGANVGQSALAFATACPEALVHSFEPVPSAFRKLHANTRHLDNVMTHPIGLGREGAILRMSDGKISTQNRILDSGDLSGVEVTIHKGADVISRLGLTEISFAKIDTEGHDLDVLHGLEPVLDQIDFIQVEAGMNSYNKTHVPYQTLSEYMEAHHFLLFYIFEQILEFKKDGRPVLRRANPVFINARLVDLEGIS